MMSSPRTGLRAPRSRTGSFRSDPDRHPHAGRQRLRDPRLRAHARAETPVIAMSGSAEIPDAVSAMHAGARDFLIKPFDKKALSRKRWQRAASRRRPRRSIRRIRAPGATSTRPGCWATIRPCCRCWPAVAGGGHPLHGAHHRRIRHRQRAGGAVAARGLDRATKPFVAVNCAAIPPYAGRVRAVRTRARRLHRRDDSARRAASRQADTRHHLPRRDRRDGAGRPGQAAAPDPGRRALPRGRRDRRRRSTCASWPPPTATWSTRSRPGVSAPICSGA